MNKRQGEGFMSPTCQQRFSKRIRTEKEASDLSEVYYHVPNGKLIALMHVCFSCGGEFEFKNGRKRCPRCQSLLRVKTMILKVP